MLKFLLPAAFLVAATAADAAPYPLGTMTCDDIGNFASEAMGWRKEGRSRDQALAELRSGTDDEKIRDEPGFFPRLKQFGASNYNLDLVMQAGRRHFARAEVRPSHPATRTILVFDK